MITVLIGHKRKSGKDEFTNYLIKHLDEIKLTHDRHAFADPIKTLVCSTFDITLEELEERKINDGGIIRKALIDFSNATTTMFGNMWVKFIRDKREKAYANKVDIFIVNDFRLLEEFDYLDGRDERIITINIKRRKYTTDDRTEIELDDYPFDITIDNDKDRTLEDLNDAAKEVAGLLETALITYNIENNNKEWIQNRTKSTQ